MKKKILLLWSTTSTMILSTIAVVSCGIFSGGASEDKSDLDFYNYNDYISDDIASNINLYYNYQQYGDLPEFEAAIRQKRVVGGVGSDYFNVNLIKTNYNKTSNEYAGLIMKLDLSRIFDISSDRSKWESELQKIYTPEMWKILNSFNSAIGDVDHDGVEDKLWEFVIPYFTQNKVIAFNKKIIDKSKLGDVDLDNQNAIQTWFNDNTDGSYKQILEKLFNAGARKITIDDYFRDNMMIGSEEISRQSNKKILSVTGNPAYDSIANASLNNRNAIINNGKKQIDAFINMINGINWEKRMYVNSGEDIESIVTQKDSNLPEMDVALIYNGDAMAAMGGGYNDGSKSDEVRVVLPKNSTFLSDGIVFANYLKNDINEQKRFYSIVRNLIIQGVQTSANYPGFEGKWNKAWENYDYVNYTPSYQNIYGHMENTYFQNDEGEDINKKFVGQATRFAATGGATVIDKAHPIIDISNRLAQPISNNLTTEFLNYFNKKDKNLT